ncbi:MAG: TIGR02678 family protein [Acidimicrobiales bacterium]
MNDEQRDGARRLLRTPLVLAARDPGAHRVIRRHAEALTAMFRTYLGYRLVVDARLARLYKGGLGPVAGRPLLRSSSKLPFTPRDYTYLSLLCAVLLTVRTQVLLSSVIADLQQAAAEAEIVLGADTLTERRSVVHALRQLVEWGALVEDAGTVADYADDPSKEALLWVEPEVIRHLLAAPLREVDSPDELVALTAAGPDAVRHAVRRQMVETPVVMADDLPEPERLWLRQYQRREAQTMEQNTGLRLEIRAEGVAALDAGDELTDVRFPREGTVGQASLLALDELVAGLRGSSAEPSEGASLPITVDRLGAVVRDLVAAHGRHWAKDYVAHPERLAAEVEDLLLDMGLLVRTGDGDLSLRAVAARYAPEPGEIDYPPSFAWEEA